MPVRSAAMTVRRFPLPALAVCALAWYGAGAEVAAQVPSGDGLQAPRGLAGVGLPQAAGQRAFEITPRVSTDVIWSDNARKRSSDKQSEFTTTVSPGVRMVANGRRLTGNLDYSLTRVMRTQNTSGDETQNSLRSSARLEAVEDRLFVDYNGSISQRAISAFGQQSDDPLSANSNRTEVRTFQLSPYLQGRVSDWADYQLRYTGMSSRSKSSLGSDQDSQLFYGSLRSPARGSQFNWSLDANRQTIDFKEGRELESDMLRGVLGYRVVPELNLTFIPGWESNNYASADRDSRFTWGVGADWAVARTKLSALLEQRFFGRAHTLSFEHRSPRTAWRISDTKNVNVSPEQFGRATLGSLYDLLFFQFESIEPDPVRRALLVESFLLANGLNGQTPIEIGFSSSGARLQRRQDVSFTLIGLRETLSLVATQSRSSSLFNSSTTGQDDLSVSSFVRQQTYSLSYTRRLQPGTSLNVLVSRLRSLGSEALQSTTLKSYSISLSTEVGQQTSASIGLRRAEFDSPTAPYTEHSIRGGLTVRF